MPMLPSHFIEITFRHRFSWKFAAYFQKPIFSKLLWRDAFAICYLQQQMKWKYKTRCTVFTILVNMIKLAGKRTGATQANFH